MRDTAHADLGVSIFVAVTGFVCEFFVFEWGAVLLAWLTTHVWDAQFASVFGLHAP